MAALYTFLDAINILTFTLIPVMGRGRMLRRYLLNGHPNCGLHNCVHGRCTSYNVENGVEFQHHCACHQGYTGSVCDQPTGGQTSHGSGHTNSGLYNCVHGYCNNYHLVNGVQFCHHCSCYNGWTGDVCDKHTVSTTTQTPTGQHYQRYDSSCNDHGEMTSNGCSCHDSWTGDICQYPPGEWNVEHCHYHCGEHGTCVGHQNSQGYYYNCKCDEGWYGPHCRGQYSSIGTSHCHNTYCLHGVCEYDKDQNGHEYNHHCKCNDGWDGKHCDQVFTTMPSTTHFASSPSTLTSQSTKTLTTTTPAATTISTTTTTTTTTTKAPTQTTKMTTIPIASATTPLSTTVTVSSPSSPAAVPLPTCDHLSTLSAIAHQDPVDNHNAIECSPGKHTSHEAFVLTECSVSQNPALWQQGAHVMTDCGSSVAIPTYTPVAAFDNGLYSSVGSLAGIFIGCTSNGFKIAVQSCGQSPHIMELQPGGSNTQNPNVYYVIS